MTAVPSPRVKRPCALLTVACALAAVAVLLPAAAMAETHTTTMTIAASNTTPLVGERVLYSAELNPEPMLPQITFYDDGTAIPGCADLASYQKCWTEYGHPGAHTITATLSSEEEEMLFHSRYELAEAPRPLDVNAVTSGTSCSEGSCTDRVIATGSLQTWTAPAGVSQATFVLRGAGGGGGNISDPYQGEGGGGGKVTATLDLTEGATLALVVGGPGVPATNDGIEVPGGFGGGGNAGAGITWGGGSGGGGSFVFAPGGSLLLAAGGGGGAANLASGGDGGQTGGTGQSNGLAGGTGATATEPGLAGPQGQNGKGPTVTTTIEGRGGTGANQPGGGRSGGGGGGGYYGGGGGGGNGGPVSAGGGGSDYVGPLASAVDYEDGAGGVGGEDTSDAAQPGEIEIIYAQPTQAPAAPTTQKTAPAGSPQVQTMPARSLHLTLYSHGGQGIINSHALTIKAGCADVSCTARATVTLHVTGMSRLGVLLGPPTPIAASSVGRLPVPVPKALRRRLRHYLLRHRGARVGIQLTVTASASSGYASSETLAETLPMWTLPGLR
jgi:hypothetical protein